MKLENKTKQKTVKQKTPGYKKIKKHELVI